MEEIIKKIDGYDDYYISNLGNVYSNKYNPLKFGKPMKKLKPRLGTDGYYKVSLSKHCKIKNASIHRLVALHFVSGYKEGLYVDHIDNNRLNNIYTNLQWLTNEENVIKELKTLKRHSFSETDIKFIREHYIKGDKVYGAKPLARLFNIDNHCIRNIVKNRYYKWVI